MSVTAASLPDDALLQTYVARDDCYTDCFVASGVTTLPGYIQAFYTTPLFRAERVMLRLAGFPSTDQDVLALAGGADRFAAWTVEARRSDQILLCDHSARTRSWLMARDKMLYFGSAVVPARPGQPLGALFTGLLGFHTLYSRALLAAAVRRIRPLPPE